MTISVFDLFSVGIGPSSSHTVGPMKAAYAFVEKLALDRELFNEVNRLQVELFGSLALTGRGHGTDIAVLNGLEGQLPETVNPDEVTPRAKTIFEHCKIQLAGKKSISFKNITLNPEERTVFVNEHPLFLNRKEFDLLYYFIIRPEKTLQKTTLAELVWGNHIDQADSLDFIYSQIKNLRKKLKEAHSDADFQAVYGIGYKLV